MAGRNQNITGKIRRLLNSKKTNKELRRKIKLLKQMKKNKSKVIGPI